MQSKTIRSVNCYIKKIIKHNGKFLSPETINGIDRRKLGKYILHNIIKEKLYMKESEYLEFLDFQLVYLYTAETMKLKYPYLSYATIKNMIVQKGLKHVEMSKKLEPTYWKEEHIEFQKCSQKQELMINRYGYFIEPNKDFSIWEAGACIRFLTAQSKQKPPYFDYYLTR